MSIPVPHWAVAAVLAVMLTGCASDGRTTHAEGEGPLSASSKIGGQTLLAPGDPRVPWEVDEPYADPDHVPWQASFGANLLCVHDPDVTRIQLEAVRWTGPPTAAPLEVATYLRTGQIEPNYGGHGNAFGPTPWPGSWHDDDTAYEITQSCKDTVPGSELTELVLVVTAGSAGAHIEETMIDYVAGGQPYTLVIKWQMVLFGEQVEDDGCDPAS
jgi:hypothetical protein